jgi:splicing factor 3B subunit 4
MPPLVTSDSGRTIRLGNLDEKVTEDLLWELFVQAGPVMSVVVPQEHKGVAMIEFKSMIDAVYAMVIMNNVPLFGKPIDVYHQYKEQYLLEEQEQMKNQHKFFQAPQNMMKKALNPDPTLLKKTLTPEQATSLGLVESSSSSDDSDPYEHDEDDDEDDDDEDDDDEDGAPRSNDEPLVEEESFELPSWMTRQSDGSFSPVPRTQDKYKVPIAPEKDDLPAPKPLAIPPPPPPKPPTMRSNRSVVRPAYRTATSLPPPPPPSSGGIMRTHLTPPAPARYGNQNAMRFVAPPSTPAGRNGTIRVVSPVALPPPPPPPSVNRQPKFGARY